MIKTYYVYIIGNERPTIYIGFTNNLIKRIYQHKNSLVDGFSKKYRLNKLLYFETYNEVHQAIKREKQIKKWNRKWKLDLIKKNNPYFKDLYFKL
ncbi:MAG: GIY-YIG nuclease family protein [Nanoarchaeota archaeon]